MRTAQEAPFDRVRNEQLAALCRDTPPGILAACLAGAILVGILTRLGDLSIVPAVLWLMLSVFWVILHLLLCWCWEKGRGSVWTLLFVGICLGEGVTWGSAGVWLVNPDESENLVLVMLVAVGVASGSVAAFGSYLPAFFAVFVPITLTYFLLTVSRPDVMHVGMAVLIVVYFLALATLAINLNRGQRENIQLRVANQDLVHDLRVQKARAEQASIDKSRFLAAASHDLRQPIHATSLFLGALRGRQMDAEARSIVGHLESAIGAMEGLFGALLDISRLDAGVVQPVAQSFAIQPMLERICRDHAETAARQGLLLVLHPCSLVVRSDPVLLERVIRNLVGNAVRYTTHGRVVIGCRRGAPPRTGGPTLAIRVWDTGPGIPAEQHDQIFEEFVQVGNPERDRSKGLGLGLAIVRRLTTLLDCPLEFRSRFGHGSMFGVVVPRVAAAQVQAVAPVLIEPSRGLILVIEDEKMIREVMRELLSDWGYDVVIAASLEEMTRHAARLDTAPDLIISDLRLPGPDDGIAAIRALQARFGKPVPGLLVTGDTAPDRLQEAERSNILLLHKPVQDVRLRAAIGQMLIADRARSA